MYRFFSYKILIVILSQFLLMSCDGSAPAGNEITPDNEVPVFSSEPIISVEENLSDPIIILATDADEDALTYAIVGGEDEALFEIDDRSGELLFLDEPDFEAPADVGEDNIYVVQVSVTDTLDTVIQNLVISVTNIDDNPPVASNLLIFDSDGAALVVGDELVSNYQYSDVDGDVEGDTAIQWLKDGEDIAGAIAATYVVRGTDVGNLLSFQVTPISDNGNAGSPVVSAAVTTTNNAPVASSVIISGDIGGNASLANVLTGSFTYSDVEGDTQGSSTFRWLRNGTAISGATGITYTVVLADVGSTLRFEATPVANTGTSPGLASLSSAVSINNNAPVASNVVITGDTSGNASVGDVLSGSYSYTDLESDAQGPTSFRWLRNGTGIVGATATTYTVVLADVGSEITFEVTPVSISGSSPGLPVESGLGVNIINNAPVASAVFVSGDTGGVANLGDVLSGNYTYSDVEGNAEAGSLYRWLRNGSPIVGATGLSYTIVSADVGSTVAFEVTPVSNVGTTTGLPVVSSPSITISNTVPVASSVNITGDSGGNAVIGDVLTGNYTYSDLESDAEGTSSFRWLRNGVAIGGATSINYSVVLSDVGSNLQFEVTPESSSGTSPGLAVVSSNAVTVQNAAPTATAVSISGDTGGNVKLGDALTGNYTYSDLEGNTEGTSTYRWLRGGAAISGATTTSYTVVLADIGSTLQFEVTPAATAGTSPGSIVLSAAVNAVNDAPVASSVNITGDTADVANVGDVLTGNYSYSDLESDAEGISTFRWLRDGSAISGATASTYTVVVADDGAAIQFEVTPVATAGTSPGSAVLSSAVNIANLPPVASAVDITGDTAGVANVGDVLTGTYTYSDTENDTEGTSTFRWLRDGSAISGETAATYTVTVADAAASLQFEVTPVASTGTSPGSAVASTAVTVPSNVSTKTVCTTNENGVSNKLGVRRYIRFDITQSQNVDFVAARTSGVVAANPDLFLYKNGVLVQSASADTSTSQSMTSSVTAGAYVLEVREDAYMTAGATPAETCYDVSITYGGGFAKPQAPVEKIAPPVQKAAASTSVCDPTGEVSVAGALSYERVPHNAATSGLDYASIISMPIRGAVVEVICTTDGLMYDTGITDASGNYSLTAPNGVASFIRVKAQMLDAVAPGTWDFQVVDNTSGGALYAMDSSATPFTPAGGPVTGEDYVASSGWDTVSNTGYTSARVAAPFAILDSVFDAFNEALAADANIDFTALNINWSTSNVAVAGDTTIGQIGTSHYNPGTGEIFVLGDEDSDTDEYDKHVIIHEWAHYFEDTLSRTDSMGGAHTTGDILDMRIAFGEGFGNAYSGIASGDSIYRDSLGALQASGFSFDVDSDVCTNAGWYSECSVQSLLFDFDTLLGFTPVYNVLVNEQKNTSALTSIFSFVKPLKDNNAASAGAIDTLLGGQSIDAITDIYGDSELSNNPGATDQLPVYEQF